MMKSTKNQKPVSQRDQDLKLLNKAKRRVRFSLTVTFAALLLWPLAAYFLISQPLLERPSYFDGLYIGSLIVQTLIWVVIFYFLGEGSRRARKAYWFGVGAEALFACWLLYDGVRHPAQIWVFLIWVLFLAAKIILLMYFGNWLESGWWPRIYFDKVVRMAGRPASARRNLQPQPYGHTRMAEHHPNLQNGKNQTSPDNGNRQIHSPRTPAGRGSYSLKKRSENGSAPESRRSGRNPSQASYASRSYSGIGKSETPAQAQNIESSKQQPSQVFASMADKTPDFQSQAPADAKKTIQSRRVRTGWKKSAVRLSLCVYGELILFPMLVHIFEGGFVSTDNKGMFALSLMFSLCIMTAVLWTIPIFYMYLEQPGARKSLYLGCAGQLLIIAYGCFMLWQYSKGQEPQPVYPAGVFIRFILLDLIRYLLLAYTLRPLFDLKEIPPEDPDAEDEDVDEGDYRLDDVYPSGR